VEETLELIPIDRIFPDPSQPRKLLPLDLAVAVSQGRPMADVLEALYKRSAENRGLQAKLGDLESLALSIANDGLLQPIRVLPDGDNRFVIEEGERRWLAHHLLYVERQNQEFKRIKALIVRSADGEADKHLLRRRVAENVHRSELNAIEMALAFQARLQEVKGENRELAQREAEAQVGRENHMSDRRVRHYLSLLKLAPEALELAKESDLNERTARKLLKANDPKTQLAMLRSFVQSIETRSPRGDGGNERERRSSRRQKKKGASRSDSPSVLSRQVFILARALDRNTALEKSLLEALKQHLGKDKDLRPAIQRLSALLNRSI
jgi:ParB/RepB/Spo0J family partition protein